MVLGFCCYVVPQVGSMSKKNRIAHSEPASQGSGPNNKALVCHQHCPKPKRYKVRNGTQETKRSPSSTPPGRFSVPQYPLPMPSRDARPASRGIGRVGVALGSLFGLRTPNYSGVRGGSVGVSGCEFCGVWGRGWYLPRIDQPGNPRSK